MYQYFVEFTGVLVILFTKFLTEADPALVGLAYFAVLTITRGITTGYFNPIVPILSFLMKRMSASEAIHNLAAHCLAAGAFFVTYMPITTFIKEDL
jgi:glycerol uptake facilitator-like aquaporin